MQGDGFCVIFVAETGVLLKSKGGRSYDSI